MPKDQHPATCECGRPAHLADVGESKFWRCDPCNAWVAADPVTHAPMGRLADAKLRYWKNRAKDAFNILWKPVSVNGVARARRIGVRAAAYKWLSEEVRVEAPVLQNFDLLSVEQCQRIYAICSVTPTDYFWR